MFIHKLRNDHFITKLTFFFNKIVIIYIVFFVSTNLVLHSLLVKLLIVIWLLIRFF